MCYKVNRDEFDIYPETWLHLDYRPTAATVPGFRSKQQNSHRMPVRCLICLSWSNTWTGTYRAFMNIKSGKLFSFFFFLIPSCSIQLCLFGAWESLAQHACYVRQQGVLLTAVTPSFSRNISSSSYRVVRPVQLGESVGASLKATQMKVTFDQ